MTALWGRPKRSGRQRRRLDRREAWQEVARLVGGTLHEGRRPAKDRVALEHALWEIGLDTYTQSTGSTVVTYTRASALFVGASELELKVRKRYWHDALVERLGWGGFKAGDRRLAERYVIRGRPDTRLRAVVTASLVEALLSDRFSDLKVEAASKKQRKALGADTRVATVRAPGIVLEPTRLVAFFDVVRETLEALERSGAAARTRVASRSA